jgi:hypothetical protein
MNFIVFMTFMFHPDRRQSRQAPFFILFIIFMPFGGNEWIVSSF